MPSSVEITLRNMRFHVCVGVLPHEAELPQPLEVDLTVWASHPGHGVIGVDYRDLHTVTSDVVSHGPLLYLESIAQRIVEGALARPNVIGARAAVRKPHVALPGPLDCAEVVVEDGVRA
jgi:7,8-dihydroneopterin aldolase/epimerase/oxygenase